MFKRLLVPLDGSGFGAQAIKYAAEVAKQFKAEIILLQVVKPATPIIATQGLTPSSITPTVPKVSIEAAFEQEESETNRANLYLADKVRELERQHFEVSYQIIIGDAASSIIDFADKKGVDMIVMTTHGKSGIVRAIMGSVADEVLRKSGKPVLVIRPLSDS